MFKKVVFLVLIAPMALTGQELAIRKLDLNKFIEKELEINTFSITEDGLTGFFTASHDWNRQIPFLAFFGKDTTVQQVTELGYIYNGAISPSGNQLVYAVKDGTSTTLYLSRKNLEGWAKPINLTENTNIRGGYFHWISKKELCFYIPEGNGDIVKGIIQNDELIITDQFETINSLHTDFSPFVSPDHQYLIFTRYVEKDTKQQGLMISYNKGNPTEPHWESPQKIQGLPYSWGAFVKDKQFYFSDGVSIYYVSISDLPIDL